MNSGIMLLIKFIKHQLPSCQKLSNKCIFAVTFVKFTMEKIIEESKQGESLVLEQKPENKKKLFIESYGCAMNFSDTIPQISLRKPIWFW